MNLKIIAGEPAREDEPLAHAETIRYAPQFSVEPTLAHHNDGSVHMA